MRRHLNLPRAVPLLALLMAFPGAHPAGAAQLVTFTRGQAIVVQSVERKGSWCYLVLEGGGEMGVPANRIASIEEYEAPPPAATATPAAPPVAAAVPTAALQSGGVQAVPQPGTANAQAAAPGQPTAGDAPPGSQANVASQGDDWRYKVRMSGGPGMRREGANRFGPGGTGGRGPLGARQSGGMIQPGGVRRPPPPQQQNPQQ